jgi:hypothetical protein
MSSDTKEPETPAEIHAEIVILTKRIDNIRKQLNDKEKADKSRNWSMSCQLVKHLKRREALQKLIRPHLL